MPALALRQRSPEWLEARRGLVTGTDIPILLGLSPYRCEADLADEKRGLGEPVEETVRMRIGTALQPLIVAEYERETGRRVRSQHAMHRHPDLEWAATSLDGIVVGERRIVELKWTTSRTRFADGLPQDVEAQVAWQLGVTGYPVADVAVLTADGLSVFEVPADPALFADLVTLAEDFRRRLAEGGPFARDAARIRRDHPSDDGTEIEADADTAEAVKALLDVRAAIARHESTEEALKAAIQARMGDAAVMRGPGWHVTWKRTKDREDTDWKAVATGLLTTLPETEREALVGLHTTVRPGFRPLRVVADKETE